MQYEVLTLHLRKDYIKLKKFI